MKRTLDLILSLAGFLGLLPVFLLVAALIRREDSGPVFFVQERIGRGGKLFRCYKFRTMRCDAEEMLGQWKAEGHALYQDYVESNYKLRNDPRITQVGRWLRARSLDELPQLLNVIKGDMSLVGPRPLLPREATSYGAQLPRYQATLPGITGLWQVSGRSDTTFSQRIEMDVHYIENRNLLYDLKIMGDTVKVLVTKNGAY